MDPVTETPGTPRFRACCPTVTDTLHELTVLWHGQLVQRVFGPPIEARKETEGARKGDVPGIFVNVPAEVWHLPHVTVT